MSASYGQGGLSSTRGQVVTPQPLSPSWPLCLTSLSPCAWISASPSCSCLFLQIQLPDPLTFCHPPTIQWKKSGSVSHSVMSDSLRPHGLKPARFLHPWNSPGKNTGMGCYLLLQGIFLTQGLKQGSSALQADSLPSEPPGSILILSPENQLSLGSGKKETTGKTKQKTKWYR